MMGKSLSKFFPETPGAFDDVLYYPVSVGRDSSWAVGELVLSMHKLLLILFVQQQVQMLPNLIPMGHPLNTRRWGCG